MEDSIEKLREVLHSMLNSEEKDFAEILKISEELDDLIIKYYGDEYDLDKNPIDKRNK